MLICDDAILIVSCSGSKLYREETEEQERAKYRTECWLERCLNENRVCAPEEHVLFVPLNVVTPLPGKWLVTTVTIADINGGG